MQCERDADFEECVSISGQYGVSGAIFEVCLSTSAIYGISGANYEKCVPNSAHYGFSGANLVRSEWRAKRYQLLISDTI